MAVNFFNSGPKIAPDLSGVNQAIDRSFAMQANIEMDKYRRRQEMIKSAMDFINIDVPAVAAQDQKMLADKYEQFKQSSVEVYKNASNQNRELSFDETAMLAKQKGALLSEAQAYNMYNVLLGTATNAYINNPDKYDEKFLEDLALVDFSKPVNDRTNPMNILAANIWVPGIDMSEFAKKVGDPNKFYTTDSKGKKTLDERDLYENVSAIWDGQQRWYKKGLRDGLFKNREEANLYAFEYMKNLFTDVDPYRKATGGGRGNKDFIPLDYRQPQTFDYGGEQFGFITSIDLQKSGQTIINGKTIQPVSVGFLPVSKSDISIPANGTDWVDPVTIKAGDPIPEKAVEYLKRGNFGGFTESNIEFKPFLTYRDTHFDNELNKDVPDDKLTVTPYNEKTRTAFAQGTNTKPAHEYITGLEKDQDALSKIITESTGGYVALPGGKKPSNTGGQQQKTNEPWKPVALSLTYTDANNKKASAYDLLSPEDRSLLEGSGVLKQEGGEWVFRPRDKAQYDDLARVLREKGLSI